MAADPIAAVRAILLADADTAALVGTNVFSGEVPEGFEMPVAALVLNPSGGPAHPGKTGGYGVTRVDVFCHGRTLNEAWQAYLTAYAALKHAEPQTQAGVNIKSVDVLSKGALGIDPTTQWPLCLASFAVLASEA